MKATTKITFWNDKNEKFFGEGPAHLLHEVEKTGSLRAASISMNMAYTKALKLIKNAETALGFSLITRAAGGKDGGGSRLTTEGKEWLNRYDQYRNACIQANKELYMKYFPENVEKEISINETLSDHENAVQIPCDRIGCVIMASGMSQRFGSNKLVADFAGSPMIMQVIQKTEKLFAKRVVVTRHKDIVDLCEKHGIDVIYHKLPYRSDTIRLGLNALKDIDACMFFPSDQPLLTSDTIKKLIHLWEKNKETIIRPSYKDVPGAPVLFPKWLFPELLNLPEGKGGNLVIKNHPDHVKSLTVSDPYELKDVDTVQTMHELLKYAKDKYAIDNT